MNAEFNGTKPVAINPKETEKQMLEQRDKKNCNVKNLASVV